jgi:hypothetical protein
MRRLLVCAAIALICIPSGAQNSAVKPQFDVASVKPAVKDGRFARSLPMLREMMRSDLAPGQIPMTAPDRIRLQNWRCSI